MIATHHMQHSIRRNRKHRDIIRVLISHKQEFSAWINSKISRRTTSTRHMPQSNQRTIFSNPENRQAIMSTI